MNAQTTVEASLASAMASAFAEIEAVARTSLNPGFKRDGEATKYADLSAVIDAIKPPLTKYGLFFTQQPQPSQEGVTVETVLHHASGDSISLGTLFVPANKRDAQGFGSALTYARRYALMTAFGVPAEDDDGADADSGPMNGKIDDHQWATITQLIEASGTDTQAFCAYYKTASVKDLPAASYDSAVKSLNAKVAKKGQA